MMSDAVTHWSWVISIPQGQWQQGLGKLVVPTTERLRLEGISGEIWSNAPAKQGRVARDSIQVGFEYLNI